jgi:putative nucleotidyltransferase with HDIG domain
MLDLGPIQEARDLPDLYAALARSVVASLGVEACLVSLLDDDGEVLRDVAGSVVPPVQLNMIAEHYQLREFPVTKNVIETGDPIEIAISDPLAHATEKQFLRELNFSRVLMCPLAVDGKAIGIVEAFRTEDRPFRDDDPQQVGLIVSFASSAHSRIRLASELDLHYTMTIEALASALEARDPDTEAHTGRIKDLSGALAEAMHVAPDLRRAIRLGALLHDVGKIGIPDSILLKPGPLSNEEWEVMRNHPSIGVRMLREVEFLKPALPIIRHHHERWDGTGYPDGLRGEEIPLGARIVAVCDAFDAMTSDRPYRKAVSASEACKRLVDGSAEQWDPECALLLVDVLKSLGEKDLDGRFVRYAI